MSSVEPPKPVTPPRIQYVANLALAGMAGQVGCVTVVIVFGALFAGLWLDNFFHLKPLFTIGLILGSVPVTLVVMIWLARNAIARIQPPPPRPKEEEKPRE